MNRRSLLRSVPGMMLSGAALSASVQSMSLARSQQASTGTIAGLPQGASSRFAQVNGVRLHYVTMGEGPLVLLLHGWPQTWLAWRDVMPALAKRFTVVAPDLRGVGLSECASTGYDKRTIAQDLSALIAHQGAAGAHVVGHDMGGKAAYVLAHLEPKIVKSLVLVDCLLPGTENMDALRGGAWHYGFHMAPDIPELLTQGRERDYIRAQIKAWSYRKDAITESSIDEYARRYAGAGRMTAGFNYYRALREDVPFVASLRGRRLPMPVMTIAGEHSAGNKLADSLRNEARDLASVIAPDSGHFVAEEVPDFFVATLGEFLAKQTAI